MARRKLKNSEKLLKYLFILIGVGVSLAILLASLQAFGGGTDLRSKAATYCIQRGQGWSGWIDRSRFANMGSLIFPGICPPGFPRPTGWPNRTPFPKTSIYPRLTTTPYLAPTGIYLATPYPTRPGLQPPKFRCEKMACLGGGMATEIDGVCQCPPRDLLY